MLEYYSDCQKQFEGKLMANTRNCYERKVSENHAHVGQIGSGLYKLSCVCNSQDCIGSFEFVKNFMCTTKKK